MNGYLKLTIAFALGLAFLKAEGQHAIYLLDAVKKEPVEGAYVSVESISNSSKSEEISDRKGKVLIKEGLPFKLSIHHLGYASFSDTINEVPSSLYLYPFIETLDEVVVTGQYEPQSARNAVYKVKTITAERIESQAANSLEDILSSELNFRFSRDNATGNSNYELQGLSGQNVKILLDGIPMSGKAGTSNAIDLNQININTIERIEIIEGPQAVNFGADALAGVINIITKKDTNNELDVGLSLHEETVGGAFSLLDEGMHNVSLSAGYKPHKHWYMQAGARANRFGGWTGSGDNRDQEWYPKTQYFYNGALFWKKDKVLLHYRIDMLDELIENKGKVNNIDPLKDPFAIDEEYNAERVMHQLQGTFEIGEAILHTAFAYTDYNRTVHQFNRNLITDTKQTTRDSEQDTTFYKTAYFRTELVNALRWAWGKTQFGLDGQLETAGGSILNEGDKHMEDLGFFTSAELVIANKLKIRPGLRLAYNSVYASKPTASINFKYDVDQRTQVRAGYGRGFRAPSIRELYHEFIDANHHIIGNEDLRPEHSHNVTGDITHKLKEVPVTFMLNGFYNHINNRITYFTPEQSNLATSYVNLYLYKTTGGALTAKYHSRMLRLEAGLSYVGRYQVLSEDVQRVPAFVFSPEVTINAQYDLKATGLSFSTFYKYTGPKKDYWLVSGENGESIPEMLQQGAYHFVDMTLKKDFKDFLSVSVGAHNVLDVTSVRNDRSSNGSDPHNGSANGQTSIAYGRSYFIRLNYQFKQ